MRSMLAAMRTAVGLARFRGPLIRSDDVAYDEARRLWNGAIDRHPALIARCADAGRRRARRSPTPSTPGCRSRSAVAGTTCRARRSCDDGVVIDLVGDEPRRSRRRCAARPRPAGRALGRGRRGDPGPWPCHARPAIVSRHGRRRADGGRRLRLAEPALGPHVGQPRLGRDAPRRRQPTCRSRTTRTPTSSGRSGAAAATSGS